MRHGGALFPLFLAGTLAGLTFWLESITQPPAADRSGKFRHDPDFIVDRLAFSRFDAGGTLQHTLTARSMMHYPDDDSTVVAAPRAVFHGQPPTTLAADGARISKDGVEVRLEGNVAMTRHGTPETVMTTTSLLLRPDDETMRGDQPVAIAQGRSLVTGSGVVADNKTRVATLTGPVRGIIYRNTESKR